MVLRMCSGRQKRRMRCTTSNQGLERFSWEPESEARDQALRQAVVFNVLSSSVDYKRVL